MEDTVFFQQIKFEYMKINDNKDKKQKRDEILALYEKVSSKNKRDIKEVIYPILRDEISYTYSLPNYQGVVSSFENIRDTKRYKNEYISNLIIMKNVLIIVCPSDRTTKVALNRIYGRSIQKG